MTLTQTPPVDSDRLDQFLGRFVKDLGATIAAGSVVIGDRLGLYRALAERPQRPRAGRRTGTATRYVDGVAARPGRRRLRQLRPGDRRVLADRRQQASRSPTRTARSTCPARSSWRSAACRPSRRSSRRSAPATGIGWHEHHDDVFTGLRTVLPTRLRRQPDHRPGSRRWTGSRPSSSRGHRGRRRRVWARRVDGADGAGLPELHVRRLRLPQGVDRAGPQAGRRGRGGRSRHVRGGLGAEPSPAAPTTW